MSFLIQTLIAVTTASAMYSYDVDTEQAWNQAVVLDSNVTVYERVFSAWDLAGKFDPSIGSELDIKTAWDLVPQLDSTVTIYEPKDNSDK